MMIIIMTVMTMMMMVMTNLSQDIKMHFCGLKHIQIHIYCVALLVGWNIYLRLELCHFRVTHRVFETIHSNPAQ